MGNLGGKGIACVGIFAFDIVPFTNNEDQPLPCLFDHAGNLLIQLHIELINVEQQQTDIGLLDGRECANDAEVFDATLDFPRPADTGSVHELDRFVFVPDDGAVNIAGGASAVGDDCLLFFGERVEQVGFADIRATEQRDA